jgi:hypothetical protein
MTILALLVSVFTSDRAGVDAGRLYSTRAS